MWGVSFRGSHLSAAYPFISFVLLPYIFCHCYISNILAILKLKIKVYILTFSKPTYVIMYAIFVYIFYFDLKCAYNELNKTDGYICRCWQGQTYTYLCATQTFIKISENYQNPRQFPQVPSHSAVFPPPPYFPRGNQCSDFYLP